MHSSDKENFYQDILEAASLSKNNITESQEPDIKDIIQRIYYNGWHAANDYAIEKG